MTTDSRTIYRKILTAILLGIMTLMYYPTSAKYKIDTNNENEYYLKGTLAEESDFNFSLDPGRSTIGYLTIVNNSSTITKKYSLLGVDSSINNQQAIIFNPDTAPNEHFGQWITFQNSEIILPPKTTEEIPFKISIPAGTFAGTYYGGISIGNKGSEKTTTSEKSFKVTVQTRYVLGLTVNVSGQILKDFNFDGFSFNNKTRLYTLSITNNGNVIMSFDGTIGLSIKELLGNEYITMPVQEFKILPGTTVSRDVPIENLPLFGTMTSQLNGKLQYFNGINNEYEILTNIDKRLTNTFFSWPLVIGAIIALIILILIVGTMIILNKKYLAACTSYSVIENDTIVSIAQKYNMDWKKLVKLNKLKPPYMLSANQTILVHDNTKKK